ncbi:MAG: NAD(P)-dependent oxidoreductase [Patescibacteria group bacterium]
MKKILVTGAGGFVGTHLIAFLAKKNYQLTALVMTNREKKRLKGTRSVLVADLSKKGTWQKNLTGYDLVIHLAAQISAKTPDLFIKNNVVATQNLIDALKKSKVPEIIHFSSAAVTSIRLDDYARTKKTQEETVRKSKLKYTVLRPSMIYGPGDTKNVGWLIKIVKSLPIIPLPGGGGFGRQPVFVEDICRIVEKTIKTGSKNKIYEIHGKEYVSMKRMINVIVKKLKAKRILINVPIALLLLAVKANEFLLPNPKFTTDQIMSLISGEKFKGDKWWITFDIIPTKFETGVAKMIKG